MTNTVVSVYIILLWRVNSYLYPFVHVGGLIGFTNIGDVNSHIEAFERSLEGEEFEVNHQLADHMLVLMVRGLFNTLEFPYVQFPCTDRSGEQMYHPFWEAVGRLECCGFRVMALVCDGLSANRRLFRLHDPASHSDDVYKVLNLYSDDSRLLTPHFIKTVRNAWSSRARKLWVS